MTRRRFLAGAAASTALVAGCAGGGGGEPEVVEVGPDGELLFRPGNSEPLSITAGTTVRFVWASGGHNVHVESQPEGAGWEGHEQTEREGFEHEHTFDVEGEYRYYCAPHRSAGMTGSIVVEPGDDGGGIPGY